VERFLGRRPPNSVRMKMLSVGSRKRPGGIAWEDHGLIFPAVMLSECALAKTPSTIKFRPPEACALTSCWNFVRQTEWRPAMRRRRTHGGAGHDEGLGLWFGTDAPSGGRWWNRAGRSALEGTISPPSAPRGIRD
jgi:hypothetical protein